MTSFLFKNARIFDGTNAECAEGMYLLVSDGLIQDVSPKPLTDKDARLIDVGGRTLMPGLIDAQTDLRPIEQKSRDHELFCSSATSLIAAKGKLLQTAPARAEQDDKCVVYYSASPRNKWR